jgi:hypothetical protein
MGRELFDALRDRYLWLVPYLILVWNGVVVLGYIRVEDTAAALERESIARANANCESVNELRREMVKFFNELPAPVTLEGGATPGELETYVQRRFVRDQEIRTLAFEAFNPIECPPGPPPEEQP